MPCSLIVRVMAPAAAVLSLAAQPAWAGGPACWNADEMPAAQLHAFHTMLMVGAMRCRGDSPGVLDSYNAFAQSRKSSIEAARTVLQARFIREMGPESGTEAFKNFDTEIANRVSMAGQDGISCDGVGTYARLASSASETDLQTLAGLNNEGVEIRRCEAATTLAVLVDPAAKAKPETPAQTEVIPASEPAAAPPEAPQAGATATLAVLEPTAKVTPPETQPASPPQVATAEQPAAVAESPDVDPAKALEDAARALAAAAISLRTASATDR